MLVIADTSPLNYLILIDAVELLPPALRASDSSPGRLAGTNAPRGAPIAVSAWANALPLWVEIRKAPTDLHSDFRLAALGSGEREAIALAELYQSETEVLLLLDEEFARKEAAARRLTATGTLGVLKSAAAHGWIHLAQSFVRLRQTNFRVSDQLLRQLLDQDAWRKKQLGTDPEVP